MAGCEPGDRTVVEDGPAFTLDAETPRREFVIGQCGPVYNRSPAETTATVFVDDARVLEQLEVRVSEVEVDLDVDGGSATFELPSLRGDGSSCSLTTVEFFAETNEPVDLMWLVELRESGPNSVNPRLISLEISGGAPT